MPRILQATTFSVRAISGSLVVKFALCGLPVLREARKARQEGLKEEGRKEGVNFLKF